jgi:hypothetical protein
LTPPQEPSPPEKGRKSFALRIAPDLHMALERWAADEMRSVNAQIEYLLSDAVKKAGRVVRKNTANSPVNNPAHDPSSEP